jgi:competence protein ComEC
LLVGDIEAPQEAALAANAPASLKADFLLVPHHGSKTSSTAAFLDAVQPQWAMAQAGYRNRFGHPAEAVAARYEARGIRLVKSASCGAALWDSRHPDVVLCQREEGKRYWHHVPGR